VLESADDQCRTPVMRVSFEASCGVTFSLADSDCVRSFVSGELALEAACPLTTGTEEVVAEVGILSEEGAELCVGWAMDFAIIFGSGRINTPLSCAVFSFHQTPPATKTESTSKISTRIIPG